MKMRTLLVDSDETLRTNLWNLLKLYQNFALEGEADTAEAAVSFVQGMCRLMISLAAKSISLDCTMHTFSGACSWDT